MQSMPRITLLCCLAFVFACGAVRPGRRVQQKSKQVQRSAAEAPRSSGEQDWPVFGRDLRHSSAFSAPAGINAGNLSSLHREAVPIPGTVDASAIYLHGVAVKGGTHDVFFVTTTYGKTVAVDANSGSILWQYTPPGFARWAGSHQITNATPVASPDRKFIYAASPDGRIQKLAVADGHAVWRTAITELPEREKIASPLSYFQDRVIAVTGGYIGDRAPYQGHVAILDAADGKLEHVWNALCSDRQELINPSSCAESGAAIWGRAGAVIDRKTGDIFVATGNALWDGHRYWGDAIVQLNRDATGMLGNYTPTDTEELNRTDRDLGSTSPVLLGDGYLAQGGKDDLIRVLKISQMAGAAPHRGGELQTVKTPSDSMLFTAPAVWRSDHTTWLFAADNGGTAAWTFNQGRLLLKWKNQHGGTSPVVAGGLLYVYDPDGGLRVYQPESGRQLADLDCGRGHWNSPIVVDGRIALPEGNANRHAESGILDIWRLH